MVLATLGELPEATELGTYLSDAGWAAAHHELELDGSGPLLSLVALDGADAVIVGVGTFDGLLPSTSARRVVHLVGWLQGRLGDTRVIVAAEQRVAVLLNGLPVTIVEYEQGALRSHFRYLASRLGEVTVPPDRGGRALLDGVRDRFGSFEGPTSSELPTILGILGVLLVTAVAIWAVFSLRSSGGGVALPEDPDTELAGPAVDDELPTEPAGRIDGLPSSCTIDVTVGAVVPRELPCEGVGGLTADGFLGPWHDELFALSIDAGVVADVVRGAGPDPGDTDRLELLTPGRHEVRDPGSGAVTEIVLVFSANNQEVVFHQADDRGPAELRLTFRLDT